MSGWTVPGYTELKTLGVGGFGAVVLARHDATGTPVAIKYLRPGLLADPEFAELFRAEAVLLSAVDSPYVVRLYEYVEAPDGAAIVMELVDGVSLHEMVTTQGKTTPEAALVVLYGSLLGLAAAHQRGVVHRDFKPANVLVNAYGASKLTDFGISARSGSRTVPAGSLSYAPPEQFDGGPATPASDVYAATATFYECLTGHPPFRGSTRDALIAEHRTAPVPLEHLPEALRPVVAAGMAKDPARRPADAAVLAAELRAAAAGAYGADWAERGRSRLGEAALALAALWPTGGAPSVHGFTAEQVQLSRGHQAAGNQHAHAQQALHGTQHNLHQWHVLHREHVAHLRHLRWLRTVTATAAACAVVAAGVTVAATRAPGGPGTSAHPAVAAYQASLAPPATLSVSLNGLPDRAGHTYVDYALSSAQADTAVFVGEVEGATAGEVARLYAQQFPFTSPPAPVQSVTLKPAGGTAQYVFRVAPALATRYQVRLLRSATAATPLATTASRTVYVKDSYSVPPNSITSDCAPGASPGTLACTIKLSVIAYVAPSALQTEMSQPNYLYQIPLTTPGAALKTGTATERLVTNATFTTHRVADNAYEITASYSSTAGGVPASAFCTKPAEAQDGFGLPGPSICGSGAISESDYWIWEPI